MLGEMSDSMLEKQAVDKSSYRDILKSSAIIGGSAVFGVVIYNLTEATFKVMHLVWIAFLLVIMVIPLSATRKEESRERSYPGVQLPSNPMRDVLSSNR
jgi:hypothetical protein